MGKFNIIDLLNDNSKTDKEQDAAFNIKMINIFDIEESKSNFYSTSGIDELADSIEMFGVQQNLILKELDNGKYEAIAGHRRRLACIKLVNEGKEKFKYVPCTIETQKDDIREKLLLICTNSTARELSDYEKVEQAKQLKELLTEYKKEHDIPGRVRDLIAGTLNISPTQVARMDSISNNLSEDFKNEFKDNNINISIAYEVSGLKKEKQDEVFKVAKEKESLNNTFSISLKEIKNIKQADKVVLPEKQEQDEAGEAKLTIDDLDLSVTAYNSLKKHEIDTVEQLCEHTENELLHDWRIGDFYTRQIISCLDEIGRQLKQSNDITVVRKECIYDSNNQCNIHNAKLVAESSGVICEYNCCLPCQESCGARCNYSAHNRTEVVETDDMDVVENLESVVEDEEDFETIKADVIQYEPESKEYTPLFFFKEQKRRLDEMTKANGVPKLLLERQKTIVAALISMVCEFENKKIEPNKPVQPVQPEIPILKNNDQRKEFIDTYETWTIWIDQPLTGERYYRYDLTDKVAMVVKVSRKHSFTGYKETKDYEYGAEQYYLLSIKSEWSQNSTKFIEDNTRTFYECSTNKSALVEYIKDFQKKMN